MTRSRGPNRGRFANRVNRSSSLHNLARANHGADPAADAGGVKWRDNFSPPQEPPGPGGPLPSFRRTTSTRSLNVNMMTSPQPQPGPMMFAGGPAMWAGQVPGFAPAAADAYIENLMHLHRCV